MELQSPILNYQSISNSNRAQVTNTKRKSQSFCIFCQKKTQHPLPETTPGSRLEFPRDLKRVHCRLFDGLRWSFTLKNIVRNGFKAPATIQKTRFEQRNKGKSNTQLTKRQSGLSLHLCQQTARLRAFVRRPLTLWPLRLVLFLNFFLQLAQDRTTLDWQDWLRKATFDRMIFALFLKLNKPG